MFVVVVSVFGDTITLVVAPKNRLNFDRSLSYKQPNSDASSLPRKRLAVLAIWFSMTIDRFKASNLEVVLG